jgi:DNA-binding NtrC family response regulator
MNRNTQSPRSVVRILFVASGGAFRDVNAATLREAGYLTESSSGAEEAWNTMRQRGYELLVVEQKLPGISGLRLVLRMSRAHLTIPVVLITESPQLFERRSHHLLRLVAVLPKPFGADQLVEIVVTTLRNAAPAKNVRHFVSTIEGARSFSPGQRPRAAKQLRAAAAVS